MAPSPPPVVRSTVSQANDPAAHRETLRHDFWYSCAYCTVAETEAKGIGFEIDHYHPRKLREDLAADYGNLFYACDVCNRLKGDYPGEEGRYHSHCYVIRIDEEDTRDHFEIDKNSLTPASDTGEFNIELLFLNRLALRELRTVRERLWQSREVCRAGLQALRSVRLDRIPVDQRGKFLRLVKSLEEKQTKADEILSKYIRDRARSPLLDPDPQHRERLERRRAFLQEHRAITP